MVVGDDSDFMIKLCLLCKGTIVLMRDDDRSKNNMIHCMNEFERRERLNTDVRFERNFDLAGW